MSASYDYISRRYGIRPKVGERVRCMDTGLHGTVRRERKSCGHYVVVRFDGERRNVVEHPRSLLYLDRPYIESMFDPEWGRPIKAVR